MASVPNATVNRTSPLKSGVMLSLSPSSDPTFDIEVARATSSGVYATVARLTSIGGMPVVFTDLQPVDGRARSYKARAVKDGWNQGAYTAVLTAKAVEGMVYLPDIAPNVTPVTGQTVRIPLFISTGSPVSYGSAASTGNLGKFLYVAGTDFYGVTNLVPFRVGASFGTRRPTVGQASTDYVYVANIKVPIGVKIDKVGITYRRGSTVSVVGLRFDSVNTTGGVATQFQKYSTSVSASRQVLSSSSFSFTTVLNYVTLAVALRNQIVDSSTVIELAEGFIRYRVPNLNKTL